MRPGGTEPDRGIPTTPFDAVAQTDPVAAEGSSKEIRMGSMR